MESIPSRISALFAGAAVAVSIWLTWVNHKNSRKRAIYSEDIFSSTFIVKTNLNTIGVRDVEQDSEFLLKVYSKDGGQSWRYKILELSFFEIVKEGKLVTGIESTVYDSTCNDDKVSNFLTKYHCIEYALGIWQLQADLYRTPFGKERWFK